MKQLCFPFKTEILGKTKIKGTVFVTKFSKYIQTDRHVLKYKLDESVIIDVDRPYLPDDTGSMLAH